MSVRIAPILDINGGGKGEPAPLYGVEEIERLQLPVGVVTEEMVSPGWDAGGYRQPGITDKGRVDEVGALGGLDVGESHISFLGGDPGEIDLAVMVGDVDAAQGVDLPVGDSPLGKPSVIGCLLYTSDAADEL